MNEIVTSSEQSPNKETEPFAIASFITGLTSLPLFCCCYILGAPLCLLAIIFGMISVSRCNKELGRYKGKELAIAGIAFGSVYILFLFLILGLGIGGAFLEGISQNMRDLVPVQK